MRGFSARQRVFDRIGDRLGRRAGGAALHRQPAERVDSRAVELPRLGRRIGTLARPDRRLDRSRLDDRDVDAPRRELDAKRVGHRLERELRHRVRAEQRERVQARDRAHVHDAAATDAQRRQAELRHPQLADDVHLELPAQLVRPAGTRAARRPRRPRCSRGRAARRARAAAARSRRRSPLRFPPAPCRDAARRRARASRGRAAAPRTPLRSRRTRP